MFGMLCEPECLPNIKKRLIGYNVQNYVENRKFSFSYSLLYKNGGQML